MFLPVQLVCCWPPAVDVVVFAKLLLLAVVVSKVAVLSGGEGEGLAVSCVFQFLVCDLQQMMDRRSNQYHYYRH